MNTPLSIPATPAQIKALLASFQANINNSVTSPSPNTYAITGSGVVATATYLPDTSILNVDVVKKPWYVPMSMIRDRIVQALGAVSNPAV